MINKAKRQIFELIGCTIAELGSLVIESVLTDCRAYCFHMYDDVLIEYIEDIERNADV